MCLDNINHILIIISIWNDLKIYKYIYTKYNILMTIFFHISNYIVREFLNNVRYNKAYLFNQTLQLLHKFIR